MRKYVSILLSYLVGGTLLKQPKNTYTDGNSS